MAIESNPPERFALGELFQSKQTGRAAIVTNLLDQDGFYGELVEIPGAERFAARRAALDSEWLPIRCEGPWYVAQFAAGAAEPDWGAHVPGLEFVLAVAQCALHRRLGEIVRFRTDEYVAPEDLGRLRFLNVTRLR